MTPHFLEFAVILFWAVWLSIVVTTNIADALKELGLLDEQWQFASGNFAFVGKTTARFGVPAWANAVLFTGVILWEGSATVLFWLLCWELRTRGVAGARLLYPAFFTSLMLWAAFTVADEVFIAYSLEATHLRLFIAQLVTLLAVVLLPEIQRNPEM